MIRHTTLTRTCQKCLKNGTLSFLRKCVISHSRRSWSFLLRCFGDSKVVPYRRLSDQGLFPASEARSRKPSSTESNSKLSLVAYGRSYLPLLSLDALRCGASFLFCASIYLVASCASWLSKLSTTTPKGNSGTGEVLVISKVENWQSWSEQSRRASARAFYKTNER